jgi:hypothetical protein
VYIEPNVDIVDRRLIIIGGDRRYRDQDFSDAKIGNKIPLHGLIPWLINKCFREPVCPNGFKVIQNEKLKNNYRFPPNHPIKDTAYALCYLIPDLYIPISNFHNYFQEMKHAAFVQLCASLGAKEIIVNDIEIDNKKLDLNGSMPETISRFGLKHDKNHELKIAYTFSEGNKEIKDYDSPWIDTEPTWKAMIELRKQNYLKTFDCEYNYTDDFGINANLKTKIQAFDINIGGNFNAMKKTIIKYNVKFW